MLQHFILLESGAKQRACEIAFNPQLIFNVFNDALYKLEHFKYQYSGSSFSI